MFDIKKAQEVEERIRVKEQVQLEGKIDACIGMLETCVREAQKICGPGVLVLLMVTTGDEGDPIVPDSSIERINKFVGPDYKLVKVVSACDDCPLNDGGCSPADQEGCEDHVSRPPQ